MTQTFRVPGQRSTLRRPGFVYAHTTRRVDRHGMPTEGVEDGYVGKSRNVARRTLQHAGLAPQRTGEIREQAWWDLKVGDVRIVEQGVWTDGELDVRERYWIAALQPRYNDRDSTRPDRIRKLEARRHRDARDVAAGLTPRQWEAAQTARTGRCWLAARWVLRSHWTWWLCAWTVFTAWLAVVDVAGQNLTLRQAAYVAGGTLVAGWVWWRVKGRRVWRRLFR